MTVSSPNECSYVRSTTDERSMRSRDAVSHTASQHWTVRDDGGAVLGFAEVFEGKEQWGVRFFDQAPHMDDSDLVRVVAHLLVWHAQCRTETVDLVLARTHEHHTLVRVSGDYV